MNIELRKTNRNGEIISTNNFSTLEQIESIEQKIKNILLNHDDQVRALYKVFFDTLPLLHAELQDNALLIPVDSQYHANKYVYTVESNDEEKYSYVTAIIRLLTKIHDTAVACINCDKGDNHDAELEQLRTIKPPLLLTDFHSDTTISVNVSESKSVRKLSCPSYKGLLNSLKESLANGKKILEEKNPSSIGVFVEQQNQAKKLVLNMQSIDPKGILLPFFRNIFSSLSYRLRYIDKGDTDSHHNICNGIILVDPPTSAQLKGNKRKPRKDKKINIPFGNLMVTNRGYLTDAGLHFCLTDAEQMLAYGNSNISVEQLNLIFK